MHLTKHLEKTYQLFLAIKKEITKRYMNIPLYISQFSKPIKSNPKKSPTSKYEQLDVLSIE